MEVTRFSLLSEDTDLIPLITNEEDNSVPEADLAPELALLPLRKQRPHTCRCRMALLYTRKCPGSW